jgi:hypothetical protein
MWTFAIGAACGGAAAFCVLRWPEVVAWLTRAREIFDAIRKG